MAEESYKNDSLKKESTISERFRINTYDLEKNSEKQENLDKKDYESESYESDNTDSINLLDEQSNRIEHPELLTTEEFRKALKSEGKKRFYSDLENDKSDDGEIEKDLSGIEEKGLADKNFEKNYKNSLRNFDKQKNNHYKDEQIKEYNKGNDFRKIQTEEYIEDEKILKSSNENLASSDPEETKKQIEAFESILEKKNVEKNTKEIKKNSKSEEKQAKVLSDDLKLENNTDDKITKPQESLENPFEKQIEEGKEALELDLREENESFTKEKQTPDFYTNKMEISGIQKPPKFSDTKANSSDEETIKEIEVIQTALEYNTFKDSKHSDADRLKTGESIDNSSWLNEGVEFVKGSVIDISKDEQGINEDKIDINDVAFINYNDSRNRSLSNDSDTNSKILQRISTENIEEIKNDDFIENNPDEGVLDKDSEDKVVIIGVNKTDQEKNNKEKIETVEVIENNSEYEEIEVKKQKKCEGQNQEIEDFSENTKNEEFSEETKNSDLNQEIIKGNEDGLVTTEKLEIPGSEKDSMQNSLVDIKKKELKIRRQKKDGRGNEGCAKCSLF